MEMLMSTHTILVKQGRSPWGRARARTGVSWVPVASRVLRTVLARVNTGPGWGDSFTVSRVGRSTVLSEKGEHACWKAASA